MDTTIPFQKIFSDSLLHSPSYVYCFNCLRILRNQSSKKNNKYQLLYPYDVPPDDGH